MVEAAMSDCLTLFHETTLLANIKHGQKWILYYQCSQQSWSWNTL